MHLNVYISLRVDTMWTIRRVCLFLPWKLQLIINSSRDAVFFFHKESSYLVYGFLNLESWKALSIYTDTWKQTAGKLSSFFWSPIVWVLSKHQACVQIAVIKASECVIYRNHALIAKSALTFCIDVAHWLQPSGGSFFHVQGAATAFAWQVAHSAGFAMLIGHLSLQNFRGSPSMGLSDVHPVAVTTALLQPAMDVIYSDLLSAF